MTTRSIIRTPRKRKVWAGYHNFVTGLESAGPELEDVLDQTATDLGLANFVGVTVMRMVGYMQLVSWTGTASTPAFDQLRIGFAWLDSRLSTATGGSGLVPRPAQIGARDTRWYQQFVLGGIEPSSATVGLPLNGDASSKYGRVDFDIHNMQKAPTADSKFNLVWYSSGAWETDAVSLQCEFDIMLALP